ncbi:hypothetical protein, conserved [Leishmania tarentolae]|uniref:Uncharacterized protein n=1 Tax=Leishmania tarentolae TaxID=5689 RepID=A0A640KK04_LEITA|nr:hypothetical protein, conserved [Leishmania tarentolae]
MSGGQFVWLSGILCDGNLQRNQLKGGEYSDSSDSSDQAVEVFYDHRSGVPQHEQADTSTVRGGDGLAHQPLRPIPGKQQQQQQPPIKQVPSAAVTTPPDEACKGSVDSFPVSTVASATPGATSSALVGVVDEAVVTMNHAVRVPSALRGAGRRTMFDVLVDVAARQRRQEQRQANPQESAEGKNLSRKAGITTGSAQVLAPHSSGTAASTLGGASSAREVTYQVLFPRTAVAAGATGTSSWGLTTSADAVVPPSLSRSKRIPAYASPVTHLSPPPSSSSPPERAKPDRGLRHLLPAHLRGCSATSQSSADHSQGHQLQTVWKHEAKHPHAWYADDRTGVSALGTSNTSSISSCSDGDTGTRDTRRPPPRRGTRRSVTESLTAASASSPQAQSAAAQTTLFSRLINGDAGEFVHPRHHHEGRHQAASERPEGVTKIQRQGGRYWSKCSWERPGRRRQRTRVDQGILVTAPAAGTADVIAYVVTLSLAAQREAQRIARLPAPLHQIWTARAVALKTPGTTVVMLLTSAETSTTKYRSG